MKNFLKKVSEQFSVFIISFKLQSSLRNKQKLNVIEVISNIVGIDCPDWLAPYQFFQVICICD